MEFFRSFEINEELGTLTWGTEIDVAPETLYAEATGGATPRLDERRAICWKRGHAIRIFQGESLMG